MYALSKNIYVKEDKRDFFKNELKKLVSFSINDEGCLQYDVNIDVENQNHFIIYSKWKNKMLWLKHLNQPHFDQFSNFLDESNILEEFSVCETTTIQ